MSGDDAWAAQALRAVIAAAVAELLFEFERDALEWLRRRAA